jgi:hypothetical protein
VEGAFHAAATDIQAVLKMSQIVPRITTADEVDSQLKQAMLYYVESGSAGRRRMASRSDSCGRAARDFAKSPLV